MLFGEIILAQKVMYEKFGDDFLVRFVSKGFQSAHFPQDLAEEYRKKLQVFENMNVSPLLDFLDVHSSCPHAQYDMFNFQSGFLELLMHTFVDHFGNFLRLYSNYKVYVPLKVSFMCL